MPKVSIELYGESYEVTLEDDESILDGALREGVDVPYACMSGTCNSCQAKLLEGEVRMEDAESLTEDEIASGEVLTCCAFGTTETLKVQFPD